MGRNRKDDPRGRRSAAPEPRRWTLKPEAKGSPPPPPRRNWEDMPIPSRLDVERSMRELQGGGGGRWGSPREQAQALFYEAASAAERREPKEAIRLAEEAVRIDPRCVDALMLLAEASGEKGEKSEKRVEALRAIVRAGEEDLGPGYFEKNRGRFWLMLETRPYMRSRQRLAEFLEDAGRREESIREYEALLDLNPNDNQGVRDVLLGQYLAEDRLDGARQIFSRYEEDASAAFAWARVLERHVSGDLEGATKALQRARRANRHAEAYLTGLKRVPGRLPEYYAVGQDSEGAVCGLMLGEAWRRHPESRAWVERIL